MVRAHVEIDERRRADERFLQAHRGRERIAVAVEAAMHEESAERAFQSTERLARLTKLPVKLFLCEFPGHDGGSTGFRCNPYRSAFAKPGDIVGGDLYRC